MEMSLASNPAALNRRSLTIGQSLSMKVRCNDFSATLHAFRKTQSINTGVRFAR
jgi:hypothetical protein